MMIEWLSSFSHKDIFLDVGANVGTYSMPAATLASKVFALELDPANIYCLNTNICLNSFQDRIMIIPIAASNANAVLPIFYRDFSIGDALQSVGREQVLPTLKPAPYKIDQLTMHIDTIFKLFNLPQPNKIKIDVDGNEELVMDGAWSILKNADEIYFEDNGLENDLKIIEKLINFGYEIVKECPSIVGSVKSDIARNI